MEKELYEHITPNFMTYAMTTIMDRSLPDVRDGCKPIHRKILYSMSAKGMSSNKDRVKCSEPISETMKIHGHGDSSIYGALALMTEQNESLLYPFIDGEGAFGKVYNKDKPSAARYTFCRLNKFTEDTMFNGINKGVVDFVEEGGHKQPKCLPNIFPNILIKPNNGIAVGMACNFPSFNLNDVCDVVEDIILNKNEIEYICPDFSTGANYIYNETQIKKIYETGSGSLRLQAKYSYDEVNSCIDIYEIPFCTTSNEIIDKITLLIKSGKTKDILDIRDETGFDKKDNKEKLKITIDLKKKSDHKQVMRWLFKNSPLESTFSANMNCLVDDTPMVIGIPRIINEWIKFRKQCINRELQYDITQLLAEQEKLNGLAIILADLDKAISLIRSSRTEKEAMDKLIDHFKLTQPMATHISSIRMVNMNNEFLTKQTDKLTKVNQELKANQENLSNDSYYTNRIISELEYIKKTYGQPRKTEIIHEVDDAKEVSLVSEENCSVCITKEGYCKLTQRRSDTHKLKDGDAIILNENITNKSTVLLFTSLGNCYKVYIDELDYTLPSNLGTYLPSQLQFDKDEATTSAVVTRDYKGHLINVFEDNRLAKITLESFKTAQRRGVLKNSINTDSKLLYQTVIAKDIDLLVQSTLDKVLIVSTSDFNAKGSKNTAGDGLIKSKNGSVVKSVYPLTELDLDCIDVGYYKGKRNSVGCYLKKTDEIKENKQ